MLLKLLLVIQVLGVLPSPVLAQILKGDRVRLKYGLHQEITGRVASIDSLEITVAERGRPVDHGRSEEFRHRSAAISRPEE